MADLLDTLKDLAVRRFGDGAAALEPDTDFYEALAIDSLQALDLLTDLEDAFDVEIPDYELQGVNSLAGLAEVIRRHR